LRIAYCDDMEKDRIRIMTALSHIEEKWKEDFEIIPFSSGEQLCENLTSESYDIILLDIVMGGIDGIETARQIRSIGEESLIIFISSYDEKMRELFAVNTIAFLDKPLDVDKLEEALRKAYDLIRKNQEKVFTYIKNGKTSFVPISQIMYFNIQGHYITIHMKKEKIRYKSKISDVWNSVKGKKDFCMPSRSYIVNMTYMSLTKLKVEINSDKVKIVISSTCKDDTIDRFMTFLKKRGGI